MRRAVIARRQFETYATELRYGNPLADTADAVAVAKGNRIFVVNYPMISSGATPLAFDRASGKLLWTGDFEALSVAHSAYMNGVEIALRATDDGDVLAVRGSESAVTYLQLFDVRDGKRRYSQTRYTY